MLDLSKVRAKEQTLQELMSTKTVADLRALTNEMIDLMESLVADCTDADVVFTPVDEKAQDNYAENPDDANIAWNLGHLIVHATASSEEAAFLAAEMARGVERDGRSRYETPWEEVTTMEQVRQRLAESRRMRLATLDVWPDTPIYSVTTSFSWIQGDVDARGRFALGLVHGMSHIDQIKDVIAQAKAARVPAQ